MDGNDRPNLFGLDRAGLSELLTPFGEPSYRSDQIFRWLYGRRELDPDAWTDVPAGLRASLRERTCTDLGTVAERARARDRTVKYRIELPSRGSVEAVSMVQGTRLTYCLSSQVGCALRCDFCLTARMGLVRHLSPGEIVAQILIMQRDRGLEAEPYNLVFMGMGEPLHNFGGVAGALRLLFDPEGFALARRRVTVSTSGLAPEIERLAREPTLPRLAVSLNATTDEVRSRLMPINRRYPIARLVEACATYAHASRERPTFEYVLLAGVNDGADDMHRLARLAARIGAKVNLIPFNAVEDVLPYRSPVEARVRELRDRLLDAGTPTSIRWSRGADARAACGQLALEQESGFEVG